MHTLHVWPNNQQHLIHLAPRVGWMGEVCVCSLEVGRECFWAGEGGMGEDWTGWGCDGLIRPVWQLRLIVMQDSEDP